MLRIDNKKKRNLNVSLLKPFNLVLIFSIHTVNIPKNISVTTAYLKGTNRQTRLINSPRYLKPLAIGNKVPNGGIRLNTWNPANK